MNIRTSLPVFLSLLLLASCNAPKIEELRDESASVGAEFEQLLEDFRKRAEDAQPIPDHTVVESDPYQLLLNSELVASYQGQGAREAFRQIVVGYPVVFDIPDNYDPKVQVSPKAVTVRDHLDSLSVQANLGYSFIDDVFVVSRTATRDFVIPAFGNSNADSAGATYALSFNNLASNSNSGRFQNEATFRFNIYEELTGLVKSITGLDECQTDVVNISTGPVPDVPLLNATPPSECYSISGSANLLTLTAAPRSMSQFKSAYNEWIASINRSAEVTLKIIELDVTDVSQQSFDFSLIRNASVITTLDATTNGLVDINQGAGVLRFNFQEGNRWDGSQIIIQALTAVGDIANIETKEFQVHNNRLLTIRNFTNERFVEEITIQDTASGGTSLSTPSITQGEIPVGQALNILPTITKGEITMHIVYNDASLDRLVPFAVGDTISGVTPIDSGSDNVFDVTLADGETVILASTHRKSIEINDEVPTAAAFPPLKAAVSRSGEKRVTQTLFVISANLI